MFASGHKKKSESSNNNNNNNNNGNNDDSGGAPPPPPAAAAETLTSSPKQKRFGSGIRSKLRTSTTLFNSATKAASSATKAASSSLTKLSHKAGDMVFHQAPMDIERIIQQISEGTCESISIGHGHGEEESVIDKRDVKLVCDAMKHHKPNNSIKTISIGPNITGHHGNDAVTMADITSSHHPLETLLTTICTKNVCPNLTTLALAPGVCVVSKNVLLSLVNCTELENLSIHDSWIFWDEDEFETSHFNFIQLVPLMPKLKGLEMTECGLRNRHSIEIYKCYQENADKVQNLQQLNLANNTHITPPSFGLLLRLPFLTKLDFSACDIPYVGLEPMIAALQEDTTTIKELTLTDNTQLGRGSSDQYSMLFSFWQLCFSKLESFNFTNCGITSKDKQQVKFLLALLKRKDCHIKYLAFQDLIIPEIDTKMQEVWQQNKSLRGFVLCNPDDLTRPLVMYRKKK